MLLDPLPLEIRQSSNMISVENNQIQQSYDLHALIKMYDE